MKKYSAILAAIAAIALCSTAKADTLSSATLTYLSSTLTVASDVSFSAGTYTYTYTITPTSPADFLQWSVFFKTSLFNAGSETGGSGGNPYTVTPNDISYGWTGENTTAQIVTFTSPIGPVAGMSAALDNGPFTQVSGSTLVPGGVPDGGLTVALLGGALVGLQILRRKVLS